MNGSELLPELKSLSVDVICMFLASWKKFHATASKKTLIPVKLLVEPFLLESLALTHSITDYSDEALLRLLEEFVAFPNYESYSKALSSVRMTNSPESARERFSLYLRRILEVKARASELNLPELSFMRSFAAGLLPQSLSKSLLGRIEDELLISFRHPPSSKLWSGPVSGSLRNLSPLVTLLHRTLLKSPEEMITFPPRLASSVMRLVISLELVQRKLNVLNI
ncbi:hypothetical protein RCL1_007968 [Eukaryota sp. TZLM3-RCL]